MGGAKRRTGVEGRRFGAVRRMIAEPAFALSTALLASYRRAVDAVAAAEPLIRNAALQGRVTYFTTLAGARAACLGMQHMAELQVYDVQAQHKRLDNM